MPANTTVSLLPSVISKPELAPEGRRKIEWVRHNMPLLRRIEGEFRAERPFEGLTVAVSVHLEAKTAHLAEVIAAGGAMVTVAGSNALSTKDDVAAALAVTGIHVYAIHGASGEEFTRHQKMALQSGVDVGY